MSVPSTVGFRGMPERYETVSGFLGSGNFAARNMHVTGSVCGSGNFEGGNATVEGDVCWNGSWSADNVRFQGRAAFSGGCVSGTSVTAERDFSFSGSGGVRVRSFLVRGDMSVGGGSLEAIGSCFKRAVSLSCDASFRSCSVGKIVVKPSENATAEDSTGFSNRFSSSKFSIQGVEAPGITFGNTYVNESRTVVHGDMVVNNVGGRRFGDADSSGSSWWSGLFGGKSASSTVVHGKRYVNGVEVPASYFERGNPRAQPPVVRTVTLSGGTYVENDIVFEGGVGTVRISPDSGLGGRVIGGNVIRG